MGRAMLSKTLIQFSIEGWGCVPFLLLDLRPNYGGGNKDNGNFFQRVPCSTATVSPNPKQATADPRLQHRFLDTHRQVWVSLLWGHCSFLLDPGAHMVMCSKLKWTGMGEFNSDDHYIYYCGQESLKRNGVAITVNKRVQNTVLGCNLKNDRMISVHFQGKPSNISVIQVYAKTNNAEEAEVEQFYKDLQDCLELTPQNDVFFIRGDWNAKVGS